MNWDPSVRARHLTIIIALVLASAGTLTAFNLSRLLHGTVTTVHEHEKLAADYLVKAAQEAIYRNPQQDFQLTIKEDPTVKALLKESSGDEKYFAYLAILSADGATIAPADPQPLRQHVRPIRFDDLERAPWYRQLKMLWRGEGVYEITTPVSLSSKPFGQIVVGVSAASLHTALQPSLRLTYFVASTVTMIALLIAVLSSGLVLRPLRELLISITQLEAESSAQDEQTVSTSSGEMQSVTQRLRVLGRRFAGTRTEIEAMRDQLQQVVGSLSERVLLLDRERRVMMASPEAERLLSNGRAMRGKRLSDALGPSHALSALTERAFMTRQSLQETMEVAANGSPPQAIVASLQLFEDRGQTAGALLSLRDFESLRQLETQLDYATKLAALSRITSGVAHEVKNPLHAMVLHLELLHAKLESGQDPNTHVEIITSEVNRLNRVVQTFLDFTRPVELKLQTVDANTLVREVMMLAADARAHGIEIIERYDEGQLWIKADADLLKQALLNIVINGCQAMPDGGRLIIATARDRSGLIHLAVSDQGHGIPEEVREKIFNLYYTTKPQGSGIGLAQAFRAVQLHNGHIEVDSKVGLGTRFRIILPAA